MAIEGTMSSALARSWGWIALRGVVAVLFGVLAFLWPSITLASLVLLWGVFALSDGILALIAGFKFGQGGRPMWSLILIGLLGLTAGVLTFLRPGITALALLAFIAAWALVIGVLQIVTAIRLRRWIEHEWMLVLSGLVSIVFGVLMLLFPGAGALAVVWLIATYAILFGIFLLVLGFRIKGLASHVPVPA